MHKFYQSGIADVEDFEDLPEDVKILNYTQADVLVKILAELGYDVVDKDLPGNPILSFSEDELEFLAKREHSEWYSIKLIWAGNPVLLGMMRKRSIRI